MVVEINEYTVDQLDAASRMLKAMAHPIRVSIMSLLEGKRLTVTQIYEFLNLEQSVVSHHLGILRDKGVLIAERDGKNVYYSLRSEVLASVIQCLTNCNAH